MSLSLPQPIATLFGYEAHYQKIVRPGIRGQFDTVGYEALCRQWRDKKLFDGAQTVSWTKKENMLTALDGHMVRLNFQVAQLVGESYFSANVSARSLINHAFIEEVLALGCPAPGLVLEITETEKLRPQDFSSLKSSAAKLRAAGWEIAIDDFGDGHGWLRYFNTMEVDYVKISRAALEDIKGSELPTRRKFMSSLIESIKGQSVTTILEGIETKEDLIVAEDLGACWFQGYLFGRPTIDCEPGRAAAALTPRPQTIARSHL